MNWLKLKLDLLPCIAQEVDNITKEYMRNLRAFGHSH